MPQKGAPGGGGERGGGAEGLTACFLLKKSSLPAAEASNCEREYSDLEPPLGCMLPVDWEACDSSPS